MRITFINKSDSLGGAAVVTLRLVEALRAAGADARMLVTHKGSDKEYVALAASHAKIKRDFLADRLPLLLNNGFSRSTLFQIDAARAGVPLYRHPWVTDADAIVLGWINQGVLSLDGIRRLATSGKPLLWTMHDMWPLTGVCHHAYSCRGFERRCGECRLLGRCAAAHDLSHSVWERKRRLYEAADIRFIAVSRWLAERCKASSLLRNASVEIIPNAFPLSGAPLPTAADKEPRLMMVAARLDDPVKGLPLLVKATQRLRALAPQQCRKLHLDLVGELRHAEALNGLAIPYTHHGSITDRTALQRLYARAAAVVSPSLFETLPGTLIEGMEMGAVPVAFDSGGQKDIVDNGTTGFLAPRTGDADTDSAAFADTILGALELARLPDTPQRLRRSVASRFSADAVAHRYLSLIQSICQASTST